jgi:threonine/homoserine/homoserine lactone efflux protein
MSDAPLIVSISTTEGFAPVVLAKALMPGRNMAYLVSWTIRQGRASQR